MKTLGHAARARGDSPPSVSVVVATYNYGRFIAEALDSVAEQTFQDFEVVIVDDGSTDNTADVVERYLSDPRFRCLQLRHVGQPRAKNAGIRESRAPLVAFLDADDRWLPTKLELQLPLFGSDPEVGVVYSRNGFIDESGRPVSGSALRPYRGTVTPLLFRDNFVCFSSSVIRRAVLDSVGLFDETLPLAIDYDLWLRAACVCKFDYVDEPLVAYRTGHANLSRRSEERLLVALGIMDRFLAQPRGLPPAAVRRSYAETYCHLGYVRRARSMTAAARAYAAAITWDPALVDAWYGLFTLPVPERARGWVRGLRKAVGGGRPN